MDLDNPFVIVVRYPLIRGMTSVGHQDMFRMVNALVCMVIHWI